MSERMEFFCDDHKVGKGESQFPGNMEISGDRRSFTESGNLPIFDKSIIYKETLYGTPVRLSRGAWDLEILAKIRHPNIVCIMGVVQNQLIIANTGRGNVVDVMSGRGGSLPLEISLRIVLGVCAALDYLRNLNFFVKRETKIIPSEVFVSDSWEGLLGERLLDWNGAPPSNLLVFLLNGSSRESDYPTDGIRMALFQVTEELKFPCFFRKLRQIASQARTDHALLSFLNGSGSVE